MSKSRREFLMETGGALAAGTVLLAHPSRLFANPLGKPIGLQLYTVKEQMQKDFDGTLKQVAAVGYKEVETAGFFDKKPAEVKKSLADAGLHCGSMHIGMGGIEETISYAQEVGAKYVISSVTLPKPPSGKTDMKGFMAQIASFTQDDYKLMAQRCNEMGEQAKKAGLQFGYHNHNFEFKPFPDGGFGYDVLLSSTDPSLVKFELDCGWMVAAGWW